MKRLRLFKTDNADKMRIARFSPSMHDVDTILASKDHWVSSMDEQKIITNTIAETTKYDKVFKLYHDGTSANYLAYYYFDAVTKPYSLEVRISFQNDGGTQTDIAFTNNQFQVYFKYSDNHVYEYLTSTDFGAYNVGEIINFKWIAYNDEDNNDKVKLYINGVLKKTYSVDYEGFNNFAIQHTGAATAYVYLIELTNDQQFSKNRANLTWSEITDPIKRVENFVERLDEPTTMDIILHSPHDTLLLTYKDLRGQEIFLVLFDDETLTRDNLFYGVIIKPEFSNDELRLKCANPVKTMFNKLVKVIDGIIDTGIITNVTATVLTCTDDEGASPGWAAGELVGYKLYLTEGDSKLPSTLYVTAKSSTDGAGSPVTPNFEYNDSLQTFKTNAMYSVYHSSAFYTELEFNVDDTPTQLIFDIGASFEHAVAGSLNQIVIYNYTTSAWVLVREYDAPNSPGLSQFGKIEISGTLSDYYDSVNKKIKIAFKWGQNDTQSDEARYAGEIYWCYLEIKYDDIFVSNIHTITANTANTITCSASDFVTDNIQANDKFTVMEFTRTIVRGILSMSTYSSVFNIWEGLYTSQNTIQSNSIATDMRMYHVSISTILNKICSVEKSRWWLDYKNEFHIDSSFDSSGVTINEDDILSPGSLVITRNDEELCNACKFIHASGVESDWARDETSITANGLAEKIIPEDLISSKAALDSFATNYVANHKDLKLLVKNCMIERNASIKLGETILFTSRGLSETFLVEGMTHSITVGKSPILTTTLELGNAPLTLPAPLQLARLINNVKNGLYQGAQVHAMHRDEIHLNKSIEANAFEVRGKDSERVKIWHDGTDARLKSTTGELKLLSDVGLTISGLYDATDNFKDDEIGALPSGWTLSYSISSSDKAEVVQSVDGHLKVLHLKDATAGAYNYPVAYRDLGSAETGTGTVEFYVRAAQTDKTISIALNNGGTDINSGVTLKVFALWADGYFKQNENGSWTSLDTATPYSADTWYHVKIEYDISGNSFKFYVDGVLKSTDARSWSQTQWTRLLIRCGDNTASECWIDAVGLTAEGYTVGDNLSEVKDIKHYDASNNLLFADGVSLINVGDANNHPADIYTNQLHYKVASASFDAYDDVQLVKKLGMKTREIPCNMKYLDPITKKEFHVKHKIERFYYEIPSIQDRNGWINHQNLVALLCGAIKQLDARIKTLEKLAR